MAKHGVKSVEMLGVFKRLPEIAIPSGGKLGVNKLRELAHAESIISLFRFVPEELEISNEQFLEGCAVLLERSDKKCTVIGFVRVLGVLCAASKSTGEELFSVKNLDEADAVFSEGSLVLSPAFQPALVLSNHFQPFALV